MSGQRHNWFSLCAFSLVAIGLTACSESDDGDPIRLAFDDGNLELQLPEEIRDRNVARAALADSAVLLEIALQLDNGGQPGNSTCVQLPIRTLSQTEGVTRDVANAVGGADAGNGMTNITMLAKWSAGENGAQVLLSESQYDLGTVSSASMENQDEAPPPDPENAVPEMKMPTPSQSDCMNGEIVNIRDAGDERLDADGDLVSNLNELNAGIDLSGVREGTGEEVPFPDGVPPDSGESNEIILINAEGLQPQTWSTENELIMCRGGAVLDDTLANAFDNQLRPEGETAMTLPDGPKADSGLCAPMSDTEDAFVSRSPEFTVQAVDTGDGAQSLEFAANVAFGNLNSVGTRETRVYEQLSAELQIRRVGSGGENLSCPSPESTSVTEGNASGGDSESSNFGSSNLDGFRVSCRLEDPVVVNQLQRYSARLTITGMTEGEMEDSTQVSTTWLLPEEGFFVYGNTQP